MGSLSNHAQDRPCSLVVDDELVIRTPLLAFSTVLRLGGRDDSDAGSDERLRARALALAADPLVREAIACASPSLCAALDAGPPLDDGAVRALTRYLVRMASRPTLFGLLAGTSVGRFGDAAQLELGPIDRQRRRSVPHGPLLLELAGTPRALGTAAHDLPCTLNATVVRTADRVRYFRPSPSGCEAVELEGADAVAVVEALEGDATPRALATALAATVGGPSSRWLEIIDLLLEQGALVSHVVPPVTGPPLADALVDALGPSASTRPRAVAISRVREAVAALDAEGLVPTPTAIDAVANAYTATLGRVPARPVDVHLVRPELVVPRTLVDDVTHAVAVLGRFGTRPVPAALKRLRDELAGTFGERRVPLLRCFDLVEGLELDPGAAPPTELAPLLDDVPFPDRTDAPAGSWTPRDALVLERLRQTWATGSDTLELRPDDLAAIDPRLGAASMVLRGELLGTADDPRLFARALVGPTGAELLGQVRHACPRVDAIARRLVEHDRAAHPDVIVAELCHAAEAAADAVTRRPRGDGYELVCLGRSGAPPERRIPASDLDVVVEDDELRLYSRRLGRRVVPRLSSNHDYVGAGFPLYRLLGMLQRQDADRYHAWSWGPLAACHRLPRVCSGRVIVAPRTWRITAAQLLALRRAQGPLAARAWAEPLGLPRLCWLERVDPRLLLDLHRPHAREDLLRALGTRDTATVSECLVAHEGSPVRGPEGEHANEVLIPLRWPGTATPARHRPTAPAPAQQAPAGWLYARIAGNPAAVDGLLQGPLGSLVDDLTRSAHVESLHWLFYDEPRFHLRLRLRGDRRWLDEVALGRLWAVVEPLVAAGTAWGFELDHHVPELDRYGGAEGLRLAEALFDADSRAALAMRRGPVGTDPALRWLACLASTDALAGELGVARADREALFERLAAARRREHGDAPELRHAIGRKHRRLRQQLDAVAEGRLADVGLGEIVAPLLARRDRVIVAATSLDALVRRGRLGVERSAFVDAVVHLHVNRMLPLASRAQELVLYGLLHRMHASSRGRRRAAARPRPPTPARP